jgi:multiple antibiotic resistance protein
MEQQLQAIATVLSLVNPMICGAMFARIEAGQDRAARLPDATKVALAVLVILAVAALVGVKVLQVFGVSLDAFAVAGGGVLSWIGFAMMRASSAPAQDPAKEGAAGPPDSRRIAGCLCYCRVRSAVVDWVHHDARQFGAGPGPREGGGGREAIDHTGDPVRGQPGNDYGSHHDCRRPCEDTTAVTALIAVVVATAVMGIAIVLMARGGTRAPGGFLRDTATQFMGLIIIAMGVQFALTGVRNFFLEHP